VPKKLPVRLDHVPANRDLPSVRAVQQVGQWDLHESNAAHPAIYCLVTRLHMRFDRLRSFKLWNSLPVDVQSAASLTTFRQRPETHLFRQSHPDIVL